MYKSSLTAAIGDIALRLLEDQQRDQQSKETEQPKECLTAAQLQLLLDEVNSQLQGRQFNTLNWELAECQGMLEQFHASNRKINKDIKLIRQILCDMRRRVNESYSNQQPTKTQLQTDKNANTY